MENFQSDLSWNCWTDPAKSIYSARISEGFYLGTVAPGNTLGLLACILHQAQSCCDSQMHEEQEAADLYINMHVCHCAWSRRSKSSRNKSVQPHGAFVLKMHVQHSSNAQFQTQIYAHSGTNGFILCVCAHMRTLLAYSISPTWVNKVNLECFRVISRE